MNWGSALQEERFVVSRALTILLHFNEEGKRLGDTRLHPKSRRALSIRWMLLSEVA